ncbi:PQQ-binding-like beta-propeller repeat protein [Chryseolinea sp. H1M3-3]|uniref:PQQ-binding-like beta-propeller repeat protein n=1 Tax=Chryseolinea sp. H1M3-3 TaxID=3034144 RepID=UPI0023EB1E46|nr:PQQ-binding-like beta-propeller repeat protein [Chryseolinea sp. H1M3-3]
MLKKIASVVLLQLAVILLYGQTESDVVADFEKLPSIEWKFKAKGPFFSSPVISENIVYAGSLDSTLYAVDIFTGKLKWKFKTGGEIRSTVSLNGDYVFLYSGDATLYSIDKHSGKIAWTFKTKGGLLGDRRYDFADYFQSAPVINDGKIFFGAGDGRVYALDVKNGAVVWVFKTDGIVHTTPVIYKDRLFIGSFDGNLYALGLENGDLLWKFKTVGHRFFPDGEVQGSPVVVNDLVYFGARDYNLYAIDAMQGYAHWNKTFPFGWAMAVTPRDSVIYVGTSDDRVLVSMDSRSGKELWRTNVKFNIFGPCALTRRMAYVGTLMGKLFGIDLIEGKVKWVYTTENYQKHHLKYFKPDDSFRDDIMNFIKTPADFIGMEYNLGAIFSTPAISHDRLLFTSSESTIYCLKK